MDDQEQPDVSVVSTNIFCKCLSYKKINNLLSEVVNSCMYPKGLALQRTSGVNP